MNLFLKKIEIPLIKKRYFIEDMWYIAMYLKRLSFTSRKGICYFDPFNCSV